MSMTARQIGQIAAAGSLALLLAAFAFQALGYAPCAMCLWQRYPHVIAIGAGALLFTGLPPVPLLVVGAISAAGTSGLGVFHTGVERDWWEGPASCTGDGLNLSDAPISDLLPSADVETPTLVLCDEVAWEFMTLSMASWNAVWSAVLACVWVAAILRWRGSSTAQVEYRRE